MNTYNVSAIPYWHFRLNHEVFIGEANLDVSNTVWKVAISFRLLYSTLGRKRNSDESVKRGVTLPAIFYSSKGFWVYLSNLFNIQFLFAVYVCSSLLYTLVLRFGIKYQSASSFCVYIYLLVFAVSVVRWAWACVCLSTVLHAQRHWRSFHVPDTISPSWMLLKFSSVLKMP